jgi:hypothetical protein
MTAKKTAPKTAPALSGNLAALIGERSSRTVKTGEKPTLSGVDRGEMAAAARKTYGGKFTVADSETLVSFVTSRVVGAVESAAAALSAVEVTADDVRISRKSTADGPKVTAYVSVPFEVPGGGRQYLNVSVSETGVTAELLAPFAAVKVTD